MSEPDPYSLPVAPTWNGLNAGEGGRFAARNRDVRESMKVLNRPGESRDSIS